MRKLIFLLLIFNGLQAQFIKGTITDSTGVVPFVNVLIKKISSPTVIFQFATADNKGFFKIRLQEKPELLFIELSSLTHESKIISLKGVVFDKEEIEINTKLDFRVNNLNEVVVQSKVAVQIKKDTTTYDPNSFKDGSERVVEDLLRKLPGVEVKEDGTIEFKGKSIKKLLLDGDDLFDSQYKIGSKNISVDMVDKVQGIERYDDNVLLKGIRESDDVVLNLVLKKGKTDLSGNLNLGYGYETNFDNSLSAILVNSKIKGFGIASYNNIGNNNTPYDVESNLQSVGQSDDLRSKTLLEQGSFNSVLDSKFHRLNNNFYASGNALFKVQKKSSLKLNVGFYNDELNRINQNNTNFTFENQNITVNETNNISKNPTLYDFKLFLSHKEHLRFHWDNLSTLSLSKINFSDNSFNNNLNQNNTVKTQNFNFKQNFNATYKLSNKTALLSKVNVVKSSAPQNLVVNPGTIIDESNLIVANQQDSRFDNKLFHIKTSLFSKKDSLQYVIDAEYLHTNSKLLSLLKGDNNNLLGNQFKNDNSYQINIISLKPTFVLNKSKYSFKLGLNTFLSNVNFTNFNDNTIVENELMVLPEFYLNYNMNKNAILSSSYLYNAILPEEDKLFNGIVQTNYRSFSSNISSLEFLKTHSYNLGYTYNNFFNFQRLSINLSHNYRPNNYFYNTVINQNITITNSFYAPLSAKNYNLNMSGEYYFHPLRTTFQFNGRYTLLFNKNIVNNSDIRNIEGNTLYTTLTARAGIKSKITFENVTSFLNNSFQVNQTHTNFQSLTNRTQIIYKPSKTIKVFGISNIITPDLKQNNNYLFLESEINYTPLNKNYGYSIIAKNLTNNKVFETRNISDFSSATSSHNLIERYVMFKAYFSF